MRSWEEAKKNRRRAVDAALKVKPDLNRQSTLDQLMVDIELLDSPNSKGEVGCGAQAGLGADHRAAQASTADLDTKEPWTTFHTNEFLPK